VRRIGRYILNAMTVVSLALFLATASLWARSYYYTDSFNWLPESPTLSSINSSGGRIWFYSWRTFWDPVAGPIPEGLIVTKGAWEMPDCDHHRWGISWHWDGKGWKMKHAVVVPNAYLALAFAALPIARFVQWLCKPARVGSGTCRSCGYDLRATPDRCPECGAEPESAP
jgi:hypothetical protein